MEKEAIANITILSKNSWNLPKTHRKEYEYWSWAKFEVDSAFSLGIWTLFVRLEDEPEPEQSIFRAIVSFLAPDAPHDFLVAGNKFDLFS